MQVELFNCERAHSKINCHFPLVAVSVDVPQINWREKSRFDNWKENTELSKQQFERLNLNTEESCSGQCSDKRYNQKARKPKFAGVASSWYVLVKFVCSFYYVHELFVPDCI